MVIEEVEKIIKESRTILIMAHKNPDGDAISSSLAIFNSLKDDRIVEIYQDTLSKNFKFLPNSHMIKFNKEDLLQKYDCIITVDTSSKDMLGDRVDALNYSDTVINIDHHKTNTMFGDYNIVDNTQPATAQLIYELLTTYNIPVSDDTMKCIITGIITDTGSFRYSLTNEETMNIAKEALSRGISFDAIENEAFVTTIKGFKLQNLARNRLYIDKVDDLDGNTVYIATTYLLETDPEYIDAEESDSASIVSIGRNIENINISIFAKPDNNNEGYTKISLRSKDTYDVSDISKYFNGGGHKLAAGCSIKGSVKEALELATNRVKEVLKKFSKGKNE